nr:hypothetical protein [Novosphingobium sediminicola]
MLFELLFVQHRADLGEVGAAISDGRHQTGNRSLGLAQSLFFRGARFAAFPQAPVAFGLILLEQERHGIVGEQLVLKPGHDAGLQFLHGDCAVVRAIAAASMAVAAKAVGRIDGKAALAHAAADQTREQVAGAFGSNKGAI